MNEEETIQADLSAMAARMDREMTIAAELALLGVAASYAWGLDEAKRRLRIVAGPSIHAGHRRIAVDWGWGVLHVVWEVYFERSGSVRIDRPSVPCMTLVSKPASYSIPYRGPSGRER